MTQANTANAGIPGLVDALNSLLCAGELNPSAKTQIVNYATTLAYSTPPSNRAVSIEESSELPTRKAVFISRKW